MHNATLFGATQTTHLKIVVIALAASIVVGVVGIAARGAPVHPPGKIEASGPAAKASKAYVIGGADVIVVR